ncbi:MAG: hypothetical protein Q9192_001364 [Flavoplaca navasiana]
MDALCLDSNSSLFRLIFAPLISGSALLKAQSLTPRVRMGDQEHVSLIKASTNGEYLLLISVKRIANASAVTTASQYFVDSYYAALNQRRNTIASFYMAPAAMPGTNLPSISFNGTQIPTAAAMQTLFEQQIPQAHYEVQCYDCHVANPNYVVEGSHVSPAKMGKNMTILVAVSGYVKYGKPKEAQPRAFSESFLLVPNPAAITGQQRMKNVKEWVIQTQTFRIVV